MTHILTHDRKCAERSGCETAPQNRRYCGTNGAERAEKARTDQRSEATDQKAGGSNPSWRANYGGDPLGHRHNCVSCTQRESKFMPRRGKSLMACHRRRGLRIVRGDDSFQNHRLSRTSSLLLPKPDPLSLGSGFVLFLAVAEVLNDCCKYYGFPLRSPPYLRYRTQRESKFMPRRGKSLMACQKGNPETP